MYNRYNYLFSSNDLSSVLYSREQNISGVVNQISQDQFLISSDDEIIEHLTSEIEIEPLVIYEDQKTMEQKETQVDVSGDRGRIFGSERRGPVYIPGTQIEIHIPFTGDEQLWNLKPSSWRTTFPIGEIKGNTRNQTGKLVITLTEPHDVSEDKFKKELDSNLENFRFYIGSQEKEITSFNGRLPDLIKKAVINRRERIKKHSGLSELLNIPIRKKEGTPDITPINVKKKISTKLPSVPKGGYKPEPGIRTEQYEDIINIIRHQCNTWEATPDTYSALGEEDLRNIINSQLNGIFEGDAAGEVFRKKGKTDICVEDKERAAFIAECKIWKGEKSLKDALEQLLSYLTWRDCKTSLILFNKNTAGFKSIQEKLEECLDQHERLIKKEDVDQIGEWRYIFKSYKDEERAITVHVFLFDLYTTKSEPKITQL